MIEINLNDMVRFQLKPHGMAAIRRYYEELGLPKSVETLLISRLLPDAEGYSEMEMWQMMHMLGPLFQQHLDPPVNMVVQIRKM